MQSALMPPWRPAGGTFFSVLSSNTVLPARAVCRREPASRGASAPLPARCAPQQVHRHMVEQQGLRRRHFDAVLQVCGCVHR